MLIASEAAPAMPAMLETVMAVSFVTDAASGALQAKPAVTAGVQVMPIAAWPPLPRRC